MSEIDEGVDIPSTALNHKSTQFSLRSLLLLFLAVGVCLALLRIAPLVATLSIFAVLAIAIGKQRRFWPRFAIAFAIMVGVNLLPLVFTWKAFQFDGHECVGFPFTFLERGGFSYAETFYAHFFLTDLMIAVGAAYIASKALKDGWRALFQHPRTSRIEDTTRDTR